MGYTRLPKGQTDFKQPRHIANEEQRTVLEKVGRQKYRVVGHAIDNVCYVVRGRSTKKETFCSVKSASRKS